MVTRLSELGSARRIGRAKPRIGENKYEFSAARFGPCLAIRCGTSNIAPFAGMSPLSPVAGNLGKCGRDPADQCTLFCSSDESEPQTNHPGRRRQNPTLDLEPWLAANCTTPEVTDARIERIATTIGFGA